MKDSSKIKMVQAIKVAGILMIISLITSCVSQKKYNTALDQIEDLRVDSAFLDYELQKARYEKFDKLYDQNKALRAQSKEIDSLSKILDQQRKYFSNLGKIFREIKNEGWEVEELDGKIFIDLEDQVFFKSGSSQMSDDGKRMIKEISEALTSGADSNVNIWVIGHTDDQPYSGDVKDNWDLSSERSLAVLRLMVNYGIDPRTVTSMAKSKYDPRAPNRSASARSKNRRTEIVFVPQSTVRESIAKLLTTKK